MSDPVIGGDGNTYERNAIVQWLRSNPVSPLTRQPMNASSLKPNYALKSAIERFKTQGSQPYIPIPSAPPADDVYYALTVHQQINMPVATPVRPSENALEMRRRKAFSLCLCFTIVIVLIIIVSRLNVSSD